MEAFDLDPSLFHSICNTDLNQSNNDLSVRKPWKNFKNGSITSSLPLTCSSPSSPSTSPSITSKP